MALTGSPVLRPASSAPSGVPSAGVRLEVRSPGGRGTVYEVGDGGFLVGSVPGCDLRLSGANLPPVVCLVARQIGGASLRKLSPVMPIAVNGRAVSSTYLRDADVIALSGVELVVSITVVPGAAPAPVAIPAPASAPKIAEMEERLRLIETREKQLKETTEELDADRVIWYRRRDEIEAECRRHTTTIEELARRIRQQERDLAAARTDLELREQTWQAGQEEMGRQAAEVQARAEALEQERNEIQTVRKEVAQIRQQLLHRYQQRRDRLIAQQQAVRKAATRVQERKQEIDRREIQLRQAEEASHLRLAELEAHGEQIQRERQLLDDQHRLFSSRQQESQRDLTERLVDLQAREQQLAEERSQLDRSQKQHQGDLVRLDRIQGTLEQKQKNLELRALEIDKRFEQLQRDSRELEEQAKQLDEWHNRLVGDTERLAIQKKEQDALTTQLDHRSNTLEGQQAMLATLRTRLERMREELRRQEQGLADQRAMQEASETDLRERLEEAAQIRRELENDRQLFDEERRRFDQRQEYLEQAVGQLRQAQESLEMREAQVKERQEAIEVTAAEQGEQSGVLLARGTQLEEWYLRLQNEQQSLRERETTLTQTEQIFSSLQEQVRRRSDELNERQKALAQAETQLQQEQEKLDLEQKRVSEDHQRIQAQLDQMAYELTSQTGHLEEHGKSLQAREASLLLEQQRLDEAQRGLASQRQGLATERIAWEVEKQASQEETNRTQAELKKVRADLLALHRQVPEMEARAQAALERLTRAREQLREHLSEIHTYARQSREDLEGARKHVQNEVERVRQQELAMQVARDEHRLSVAAFRQQLIEWQGMVGEMKQTLEHGASRLDQRQAEVEEQAQLLASTEARLAEQAEQLEREQQQVARKRGEMDRHLIDMREWYRRKLRELAGVDAQRPDAELADVGPATVPVAEGTPSAGGAAPGEEEFGEEIEPADQQLGQMLHSLELIDGDTLTALLLEARRQRRSLRQLLLAGNYLTLYQMALIEAGNLDALVLGPVRVIDRLQSTPHEAVYRVFDPRRNREVLLRHLAEAEMEDAIHPDEFRQRFAQAAALDHPNLANVLEVVEISDRPAVLIEWLHGVPSSDWPALAGAPGAWYRLVNQAAVALAAIHEAGLTHGHLHAGSFLLTEGGVVKLCGLGEPSWLDEVQERNEPESQAGDLAALGRLAAAWAALANGTRSKKPFPPELAEVLGKLQASGEEGYPTVLALLADLEKAGTRISGGEVWERLQRQLRDQRRNPAMRRTA